MKKPQTLFASGIAAFILLALTPQLQAAEAPKIGLVNFKTCVEKSKLGKQEQEHFEGLKKQMEGALEEKEKSMTELSNKFNDPDYLDSLSSEAEAELKHKLRTIKQELAQHQQHYFQILNQANYKIIQGISEKINEAAKIVAKNKGIDLIFNDESTFFHSPAFDVTNDVVRALDELHEQSPEKKQVKKP